MVLRTFARTSLLLATLFLSVRAFTEQEILENLYYSTQGEQWLRSDHWLAEDIAFCQWYGIVCDEAGSIREIRLPDNNLAGAVTTMLYDLPNLHIVDLKQNPIHDAGLQGIKTGQAPLQVLDFEDCLLSDVTGIANASSTLLDVRLTRNQFRDGFPTDLLALTKLEQLFMTASAMPGRLPAAIVAMTSLVKLHVDENRLTGELPPEIGALTRLQILNLGGNFFNGTIPQSINQLTELTFLDIEANEEARADTKLSGPLPSLASAPKLDRLLLARQALSGPIPDNLLAANQPDETSSALVVIDLLFNQLTGALPTSLARFPVLNLNIIGNPLSEPLPAVFCDKKRWMNGHVGSFGCNAIACPVGQWSSPEGRQTSAENPCQICSVGGDRLGAMHCGTPPALAPVVILAEFYQALGGPAWTKRDGWGVIDHLVDSEGDLSKVDFTGVDVCSMYGIICDGRGNVVVITMTDNNLIGTIPESLFQLPFLVSLDLSRNFVELDTVAGNLEVLRHAESLTRLTLSHTKLKSLFGIGRGTGLSELALDGNYFESSLPDELFSLTRLSELNLAASFLTGIIPEEIQRLSNLKRLHLQENQLRGALPPEFVALSKLEELDLSRNRFGGGLPAEWNNLRGLSALRINRASIGGELIPFAGLERIDSLELADNELIGSIPSDFLAGRNPYGLMRLDLSNNHINGTVPATLGKFDAVFLELHDNMITGIADALCFKTDWMGGEVGRVPDKCEAILCPSHTWSPLGRSSVNDRVLCSPCNATAYFGATSCNNGASSANRETEILDLLFRETGGDSWTKPHDNWTDTSVPICYREGIVCDPESIDMNSLVTQVNLNQMGLVGKIPSEVFDLPHVEVLGFSFNNVDLSLDGVGRAEKLQALLLSGTNVQSLAGLENAGDYLYTFHLARNQMKGTFPTELLYLSSIRYLQLSDNQFSSTIPSEIGLHMKSLQQLHLQNNRLVGFIPPELALLPDLVELHVPGNALSGILPGSFNELESLRVLDLSNQWSFKKLSGPLVAFNSNPLLTHVDLSGNRFAGTVPPSFLSAVERSLPLHVNLSSNELFGAIPGSFDYFQRLEIDLTGNMIDAMPSFLCDNSDWMGGNVGLVHPDEKCDAILCRPGTAAPLGRQVRANMPCQKCATKEEAAYFGSRSCKAPSASETPCAADNTLGGSLICDKYTSERSTLEYLFSLTGGGGWTNNTGWMTDLPICRWDGVVCVGDPSDNQGVLSLDLSENRLSGVLPVQLWSMPSLRELNLQGNAGLSISLEGLPAASPLERLLLSGTRLRSLDGLTRAPNLRELSFSGLVGTFPSELFSLKDLVRLNIASNRFVGMLPAEIGTAWNRLESFDASGNDFYGTIPRSIGQLSRLEALVLDENLFSGELPADALASLSNLQVLSISRSVKSGRRLSGKLSTLVNMTRLEVLQLDGNALSGAIPTTFVSNSALRHIDLRNNQLTGTVPETLTSFGAIDLFLAGNHIEELSDKFCWQDSWNGGAVGQLESCDAILCPPDTSNPYGRAMNESMKCQRCPDDTPGSPYFGSTDCFEYIYERDILTDIYEACGGDQWYRRDFWLSQTDICNWHGVGCENGRVTLINLQENNLVGTFPQSVYHLPELRSLILSSNLLDEIRFDNASNARNLQELRVDDCSVWYFFGIEKMTSLTLFDAGFNAIMGEFPWQVLELPNLRFLSLRGNAFTGRLPPSLGQGLPNLRILRVDDNRLEGTIPSFSQSKSLTHVFLGTNQFSGSIPADFLESVPAAEKITVDLSNNKLTGSIPTSLGRLDQLSIYLRNNRIEGIPNELCSKADWNNGDVGKYGCEGILCSPGTSNIIGRESEAAPDCLPCKEAVDFHGQTSCHVVGRLHTSGTTHSSLLGAAIGSALCAVLLVMV